MPLCSEAYILEREDRESMHKNRFNSLWWDNQNKAGWGDREGHRCCFRQRVREGLSKETTLSRSTSQWREKDKEEERERNRTGTRRREIWGKSMPSTGTGSTKALRQNCACLKEWLWLKPTEQSWGEMKDLSCLRFEDGVRNSEWSMGDHDCGGCYCAIF